MVDWFSTMHHNNQGSFSSDEVDQKLEEGIDCKSLLRLGPVVEEWEWVFTSYISRTGSTNIATFVDLILDHDAIEYIGTLDRISTASPNGNR